MTALQHKVSQLLVSALVQANNLEIELGLAMITANDMSNIVEIKNPEGHNSSIKEIII